MAKHLVKQPISPTKKNDTIQIIDPCAGEGKAIETLAGLLEIPHDKVYAIELDAGRGTKLAELMPTANICAPASFMNVTVTFASFGIAYVNPPFDYASCGMREEQLFTEKAAKLLATHGVLALVCPFKALVGNRNFTDFLDMHFEDTALYKFPDGTDDTGQPYRPYNEIVCLARKRRQPLPSDQLYTHGPLKLMGASSFGYIDGVQTLPPLGGVQPKYWNSGNPSYDREDKIRLWEIPGAWKPLRMTKTKLTEEELIAALAKSPLNEKLKEVKEFAVPSPPLPLQRGHLGLVLASGMLNGVVEGPHGAHVVRGSSSKIKYHNTAASSSTTNPENGAVTTKDVYSERLITTIRVVDDRGKIQTFSNAPAEGTGESEDTYGEGDE